jgi:hypothetical protein
MEGVFFCYFVIAGFPRSFFPGQMDFRHHTAGTPTSVRFDRIQGRMEYAVEGFQLF